MADTNFTQSLPAPFVDVMSQLFKLTEELNEGGSNLARLGNSMRGIATLIDVFNGEDDSVCPRVTLDAMGAAVQNQANENVGKIDELENLLQSLAESLNVTGSNHE